MVEELAARGVPLAEIRKLTPERRMRVLPGRLTDAEAVADALTAADAKVDLGRWYLDLPLIDHAGDETYILSKMWGLQTRTRPGSAHSGVPRGRRDLPAGGHQRGVGQRGLAFNPAPLLLKTHSARRSRPKRSSRIRVGSQH